jgi:hypothetical protein
MAILPPVPEPLGSPFYYSSLTNVGVYYLIDPDLLEPFRRIKDLVIATFDGKACLTFNFQSYTGQFPFGSGITQEIELQFVAYPRQWASQVPALTFDAFLRGDDQTKVLGNHRIWVPCDACIAIHAGVMIFDEPKFTANFETKLPSLNDPSVSTWTFACYDQSDYTGCSPNPFAANPCELPGRDKTPDRLICECTVDVRGIDPFPGNFSPITEFGRVTQGEDKGKLTAARWNILQPLTTYRLSEKDGGRVNLRFGTSQHQMRKDLEHLIGAVPAAAAYTFQSAPAAVQARPFVVV